MRAIRVVGNAVLWVIAVLGVLSMVLWGATKLGYVRPLVVISGSMEPAIMTGDLLFDTPHPTRDLETGDVVAIQSEVTGNLISHRVVKVVATDGHYEVNLKGDANQVQDGETYVIGDTVLRPVLRVPHGGYVVTTLTQRSVAVPLGITLLAVLGLTFAIGDPAPSRRPADRGTVPATTPEPQADAATTPEPQADATTTATVADEAELSGALRS